MSALGGIVLTDEFTQALDLLAQGRNLFLTGKAGTGKSTLVRQFMAQTDRNVVVAAPTGIAALNVGGYTIHRLFGFATTTSLDDVLAGDYYPGRFSKTLKTLDTLIIDEASMVRADLFDKLAAALVRFGPKPGSPFGGVQIVLVGDLYQLPPVVQDGEVNYIATRYETPYFYSADSFSRADFPIASLTTVFRQLGDDRMTAILNDIREGVLIGNARDQLNARADPDFVPPDGEFWLTLAPTNRLVAARNRQQLERLAGDEISCRATQSGDLSLFDPPADEELRFKIGAQIMMLNNDQSDRWVNGTLGRVAAIDGTDDPVVTVEFRDGTTAEVGSHTWEATRPVVEGGSLRHEVVGTFTQLPFKLAWAITVHKSQGQTLDRLVVDLSGGMFAYGQLYVALSRCTSLNGLVLKRPVLPKDLKTDRRIARFLRGSDDSDVPKRWCALSILTVGDEGKLSRPRPVEIAVAFDDGTAVSSLVNPQRDIADARGAYNISVGDILLAPSLLEAWNVISPMLAGFAPVGVEIDHTLGLVDFELKRLGHIAAMPLGVEVAGRAPSGGCALDRARAIAEVFARTGCGLDGASAFEDAEPSESNAGHLISRRHDIPAPVSPHLPGLAAILDVSRMVGPVLLGAVSAEEALRINLGAIDALSIAPARNSVAEQLKIVAARVKLTDIAMDRLVEAERFLGVEIIDVSERPANEAEGIAVVLVAGARICFTGTVQRPTGEGVSKEELNRIATSAGLIPVNSVTRKKCEALVVAEIGTQSEKARKAAEFGKPVFSADEFLTWAQGIEGW